MKKQGRKRNYGVSVRISVTWLLRCVAFDPQIIQTCTLFYKKYQSLFVYLIISIWCRMRRRGRERCKKRMASPRRKTSSFKVLLFLFILQVNGRPGSCLFIKLSFSMSSRGLVFSGVLSHLYNVSVCKLFLLF
jgi:hypothetical protein